MKAFSVDLRQRILDAYDAGEGSRQQIADRFSVSLGLVKKLLAQRKATGAIDPIPRPGRTPIFHGELLEKLDAHVREHPDATLKEIRGHFAHRVRCSNTAVCNALKRLDYRRKKNAAGQRTRSR
jgi:transposase